jgi:hypothetical protein
MAVLRALFNSHAAARGIQRQLVGGNHEKPDDAAGRTDHQHEHMHI